MVRYIRAALVAVLAIGSTLFVGAMMSAAPAALPAPDAAAPVPVTLTAIPGTPVTIAPIVIDLTCVSPNSTDFLVFVPPLTMTLQSTLVQKLTNYHKCAAPTVPSLNSGSLYAAFTIPDMCPMVTLPGSTTQTITWNTGQTTTMSLNRTATVSGTTLVVTFTGTVTAGLFTGSSVRQTYTASAVDLQNCLAGAGVVSQILSAVNLRIYH